MRHSPTAEAEGFCLGVESNWADFVELARLAI